MPKSPLYLLLLLFLIGLVTALLQLGIIRVAFEKLDLSQASGLLLLWSSLLGSLVNVPLVRIRQSSNAASSVPQPLRHWPAWLRHQIEPGKILITVNLGGCLIPATFSLFLITHRPLPLNEVIGAVGVVTGLSYFFSRPVSGIGIVMPIFLAPLAAALAAHLINPEQAPALAYIGGTLGVLIGADLFRLKDISTLGTPLASIGGAGTFDGIFLAGLIAVLLA
jgi:uncharacterized membrane protein